MIVFDRKTKRYRQKNGRFVALATVRREIGNAVDLTRREMREAGEDFSDSPFDEMDDYSPDLSGGW